MITLLITLIWLLNMPQAVAAPTKVNTIKTGVQVRTSNDSDWNTPLISAFGELSTGALNGVSNIVRENSKLFGFAMMANLRENEGGSLEIADFGVSVTMRNLKGEPIATSASNPSPKVKELGLISRMVLKANEEALSRIKVIAQSPQLILIEAPTIMHIDQINREVNVRYVLLLDEKYKPRLFVFGPIIENKSSSAPPILRELVVGMDELRQFYVDGDQFTFGIPSKTAFGLVDLPPGRQIEDLKAPDIMNPEFCPQDCISKLKEYLLMVASTVKP